MQVLPPMPSGGDALDTDPATVDGSPDETFISLLGAALAEVMHTSIDQSEGETTIDAGLGQIDLGEVLAPLVGGFDEAPVPVAAEGDETPAAQRSALESSEPAGVSDTADLPASLGADGANPDLEVEDDLDAEDLVVDDLPPVVDADADPIEHEEEPTGQVGPAQPEPVAADPAPAVVSGPMPEFRIPAWIIAQYQEEQANAVRLADGGVAAAGASVAPSAPGAANAAVPTAPVVDPGAASTLVTGDGDSPWEQLASVVRPLRQMADGSHRISLQLRPAELGVIHLEVAFEDGRLSLRAVAENVATRDVLAASLPELRAELSKSGIDLGSLDVGEHTFGADPGSTGDGDQPPASLGAPTSTDQAFAPATTDPVGPATASPTSSRLDVAL